MPLQPLHRFALKRLSLAAGVLLAVGWNVRSYPNADLILWASRAWAAGYAVFNVYAVNFARKGVRAARARAAKNILETREKVYGDALHQYRPASLDAFPHLDRPFYDMSRAWLETQGFQFTGDLENVSLNKAFPKSRSVLRMFIHANRQLTACAFQVFLPGPPKSKAMRVVRRVEIGTDFSDGSCITTFAGPLPYSTYPFVTVNALPTSTRPEELLRVHNASVATMLAQRPDLTVLEFDDLEQLIQGMHRQHERKSAHKASLGWAAEREARAGRPLTPNEASIAAEIQKVEAENRPKR